ncbi:(R)-citramalate synthase [Candidatus Syntrophocurvum alkaliphilum]|uniref:Citramalate synthase n=1 Tax=Candidatus Syntrophocurvum alkaliphilum TaxID=2293317 RepID=A0A6I6DJV0_9FIRM|nr:citramalate synthase [Candidatus Syntrophocurvum alkaliphilum]QGU00849.1 (R)-citramalate synthase [Candidatus Syntrophocurvum alkaliphilum]
MIFEGGENIGDKKLDVFIYDTTLRDGSQGEGISLSVNDKLKIAKRLDLLGVSYIEGGWPGSNPKDRAFFLEAKEIDFQNARIAAFGSTRKPDTPVTQDSNVKSFMDLGVSAVTLVGKSWDFHVSKALETTLEENLSMIKDTVMYLKDNDIEVIFDAEHFFDGYKNNTDYAIEVLKAAADTGADWIVLCDTNGGTMPWELEEIIDQVQKTIYTPLGIHVHNDAGCAVSNTLLAVRKGITQVQGTMNGYGERCGNADLCAVMPNIELKMNKSCLPEGNLKYLSETSHYISEIANMPHHNTQPFVGKGAFAHKGGIHVSAILKDSLTYEHINPEDVGNNRRVLVSELSGLSNLLYKAKELNIDVNSYDNETRKVIKQIKELENEGFQFEGADASLELFLRKAFSQYEEFFQLKNLKIILEKNEEDGIIAEAMIKVTVGDQTFHTAAEGDGPVNALDNSLRKALTEVYPEISEMHLTDYKVRVLNSKSGTAAKVRVLIESANQKEKWSTVGVSENIIEASWQALVDSINYLLLKRRQN